jgi:peroxiredoxin Q/BCP
MYSRPKKLGGNTMSVQIGQTISDFTLPSSNGEDVSLSHFLGKFVVLYFYPKDMTPGCTTESCSFRDFNPDFSNLNAVIIGISPDDIKSHRKFIEKYDLPFILLSDSEQQVSNYFGVWVEKKMYGKTYMGVERSTFLIGLNGELLKEWRKVKVEGHTADVLESLEIYNQ